MKKLERITAKELWIAIKLNQAEDGSIKLSNEQAKNIDIALDDTWVKEFKALIKSLKKNEETMAEN
jgi:hypothetical protein